MSYRTPSSATHVGFPTVAEQDDYEDKTEASWTMPQLPLRAVNPTVLSSDISNRGALDSPPPPAPTDPRLSAHVQRWNSMVELGPPPTQYIGIQPTIIETMSVDRYTNSATLDTFPYERAPNLQKLTKG